jgi:hypothetical protein
MDRGSGRTSFTRGSAPVHGLRSFTADTSPGLGRVAEGAASGSEGPQHGGGPRFKGSSPSMGRGPSGGPESPFATATAGPSGHDDGSPHSRSLRSGAKFVARSVSRLAVSHVPWGPLGTAAGPGSTGPARRTPQGNVQLVRWAAVGGHCGAAKHPLQS